MSFATLHLLNHNNTEDKKNNDFDKISLNKKVDDFIEWYSNNTVKERYSGIGLYNKPKEMRDFIEKMAVWYELRYPDSDVNSELFNLNSSSYVSEVMFKNNKYITDLFDKDSSVRELNWKDFYNTKAFIDSLSYEEKELLEIPYYPGIVYLAGRIPHLHLSKDGCIIDSENVSYFSKFKVKDSELVGLNIEDAIKLIESRGVEIPDSSVAKMVIADYKRNFYQKDEMLNCVMYRIIERGGNRIGPRRALLFAKEFNRDVNSVMKYGIDTKDPDLELFIKEGIKLGCSKDLDCYKNYFSLSTRKGNIDMVNISHLLLEESNKKELPKVKQLKIDRN